MQGHSGAAPGTSMRVAAPVPTPVRITMGELHRTRGVPRGWRLAWPATWYLESLTAAGEQHHGH